MAKPPKTVSSARNAARSRRSGSAAAPTAARGIRLSRNGRRNRRALAARRPHRYALAGAAGAAQLYAEIELEAACARLIDRHRRVRSRARRRRRARIARAARRRAGHRQVRRCCCRRRPTWRAPIGPVLYSSGEESEHQIKSRGERLAVGTAPLYLLAETCLERILEEIARIKPALVIVDSVQTVFSLKFQSAPGSIGQVARGGDAAAVHGEGPEHSDVPRRPRHQGRQPRRARRRSSMSSTRCSYFEGERHHSHRVVRAVKNRFRRGQRARRLRDDVCRPAVRPEPVEAVSRRAAGQRARVRRCCARSKARGRSSSRCRRSSAAAPTATARRDGERHRSAAPVAAARRARETRRPEPHLATMCS